MILISRQYNDHKGKERKKEAKRKIYPNNNINTLIHTHTKRPHWKRKKKKKNSEDDIFKNEQFFPILCVYQSFDHYEICVTV